MRHYVYEPFDRDRDERRQRAAFGATLRELVLFRDRPMNTPTSSKYSTFMSLCRWHERYAPILRQRPAV